MSNHKEYFYICEDCEEAIKSRLDTILNFKNPRCRHCDNVHKGIENRDKISEVISEQWAKISEDERKRITNAKLQKPEVIKKRAEIVKQGYASGKLKAWNEGNHTCLNTGKTHIKKGQHLAPEYEFKRGENHIYWKIDRNSLLTPLRNSIRSCINYIEWRNAIYKRDSYICQICKEKGGKLNSHHIKAFEQIIKENNISDLQSALGCSELWDTTNGITVCDYCHKWIHSINPQDMQ